ncbi:hypothetical protein BT96DRAFT_958416 [Gymnopus androsaceus JB14]|uniref:DDE Tnp4 domain-containing protein n=1 Tax=Gymnopus androsaceus JB14 TaxID=1447944 RepID=A0A6A4HDX6_9AGAR|nr:hypothetical protein BT96DRAFT_958416 [Gymnopus androsaceus JB14]
MESNDNLEAQQLLLALDDIEFEEEERVRKLALQAAAVILHGITEIQCLRSQRCAERRLYLTRSDLLPNPRIETPWQVLLAGEPPRVHRRSLDAAGALGLILHYLNSTMLDVSLEQIFALIPTTFVENEALILAWHPLLEGAFGSVDGLNLPVQVSHDDETENSTYNGWLHEHFCSRSWHDSRVAQPIYEKLHTRTPDGYYLVADTAFPRGTDHIQGRIRAPVKDGTRLPQNEREQNQLMAFDSQLLSYHQTADFGRLRVPLPITYHEWRGDLLEACTWLFNL